MRLKVFVAMGMLAAFAPLGAQEVGVQERASFVAAQLDAHRMVLTEKIAAEGLQQRMAVESRFTPGAPYAGEAINESVQVLADGNRISKKSVTRIYRDSEGRTRREQIGADGQAESINISDPVAGVSYVLNPQTKTAFRNGVIMVTPSGYATATVAPGGSGVLSASKTVDGTVTVEAKEGIEVATRAVAGARGGGGGVGVGPTTMTVPTASGGGRGGSGGFVSTPPVNMATVAYPATAAGKTTTEELGQQIVEGVLATGRRSTTVIDAGTIGNERPIHIVSEQWTAADLKLLVATKHTDPRTGETTYRLTNITQAEQPRSLFEVPSDYTLKESTIRRSPALEK
jgi:hypothetical protein